MCDQDRLALELPEALSDEAAAQLIDCLYALGGYLENRYYAQLHRYYPPDDPHQLPLWHRQEGAF